MIPATFAKVLCGHATWMLVRASRKRSITECTMASSIMLRLRCKASPERIAELRNSLNDWIESTQDGDDGGDQEEFGALIAFYPLVTTDKDN